MNSGQIWEYNTVGGAWTNVTPAGMSTPFGGISVDPANPKHLLASTMNTYWTQQQQPTTYGDRIFTSLDAGRSWTDVVGRGMTIAPNGIEWSGSSSIHWAGSIEFDPFDAKSAWVVSGNGLFKTTDLDAPTSSWKFDVHGMEETGVYQIDSIPDGPLMTVIGDYDGFLHTDPAQYGVRHTPSMGSTTGQAVAAQATHVLARIGNSLYISTNMGVSWQQAPTANGSNRGNLALSADGFVLLHSPENSAITYRSTDFGANWTAVAGLAVSNARPVADQVNPARFYVYDRATGQLLVSTDGGISFTLKSQLTNGGSTFLRATPGREGDLWACLDSGGLNHSTDGGATFTKLGAVNSCGAVGLGKAAPGSSDPAIYMWGAVGTARGLLRSIDQGATWDRLNDDAHQYGGGGYTVSGDMNTYGTVYMSTNGRGVAYGKIDPDGDVTVVPQAPLAQVKPAECKYVPTNVWWGGHIAEVRVTNTGPAVIHGWTVSWTYSDKSAVQPGAWNGVVTGSAPTFSATDVGWNHDIYPGQTATVGMVVSGQDGPDFTAIPVVTGDVCK